MPHGVLDGRCVDDQVTSLCVCVIMLLMFSGRERSLWASQLPDGVLRALFFEWSQSFFMVNLSLDQDRKPF